MNKKKTKEQRAVALSYDGISAPIVAAKGRGNIAEQIIKLAKEHDIPLREEPALVDVLSRLELGEQIPRALYLAVAELIAFSYMIKGKIHEHQKS